jgi:hypothetical protein
MAAVFSLPRVVVEAENSLPALGLTDFGPSPGLPIFDPAPGFCPQEKEIDIAS